MTGFIGEIISRQPDAVVVRVAGSECDGGCGCQCRKAATFRLPPMAGRRVSVSLRGGDRFVLLVNTLLYPLGGFIAGAIAAQWAFAGDLAAFAGAMAGLGVGLLMCRGQSFERVVIEEVSNE